MKKNTMKVIIIRCGALGDLVYATSVIDALRAEFGNDTIIDFVSTPGTGMVFNNDNRVNQVFPLKHKKVPIWLSKQKKDIIKHSKNNPYDLLINFEYGKQFISLEQNIVATKKINARDIQIPTSITHVVEKTKYIFKDLVSSKIYNNSFPKVIGSNPAQMKEKYNLDDNYIIISPSNSHQKRNIINYRAWTNENWIKLIKKISLETQVVIIGNKGEDHFFDKLKPYPSNAVDLVGKTSLSNLIGVIDGANKLISTDTGTAHIASAVNTDVVALIGPTPVNETAPYKTPFNNVFIVSANLECSPCYKTKTMWKCKDNICMKQITVDMVYKALV
jgi:ADP-heptose:LPS heptosyltransferase